MNSIHMSDLANVSFFTVPIVFVGTCGFPLVYAILRSGGIYDNASPRDFRDAVAKSEKLTKEAKQHILRAKSASDNGFETLGIFAAAIVAINLASVDVWVVNWLSVQYVTARIAYVFAYVWLGKNRRLSWVRSLCFGVSAFTIVAMWIVAGLAMVK